MTSWIVRLKAGDPQSVDKLWERYFPRLMALAGRRLGTSPRGSADEEDVALSAFDSFCRRAQNEQFMRLEDRDDLWQILGVITIRKAIDLHRREKHRNGGGRQRTGDVEKLLASDPSPEMAVLMLDEYGRLMGLLPEAELRQIAVLRLEGYRDEEIGRKLQYTRRTVQRKLARIRLIWAEELA